MDAAPDDPRREQLPDPRAAQPEQPVQPLRAVANAIQFRDTVLLHQSFIAPESLI